MNSATEVLIRRAVSQAASLARQQARCVYTDRTAAAPNVATAPAGAGDDAVRGEAVRTESVSRQKTMADLPGPEGYPIVGTAPEYFRKENRGQMHEVQRRYHAKYGRMFKERLGPVTNLSIADPQLVEEIFRSEGKYPNRPPYEPWLLYKQMRKRSKGIVSASGEEWHKIRTVLNKRMLKPSLCHQYAGQLSSIAGELSDKLRVVRDRHAAGAEGDNTIPDVLNLLYSFAIESIGQVLIDKRFGCLNADMSPTMHEFVRAIENMMYTSHQLMVFSNVHKRLNTKPWRTHVESWDKIMEVAKDILDSKRRDIEERLGAGAGTGTVENATVLEYMLASENLSMEEIYTNNTELLLSGVDTTSNTVAVAIYLLSKHPHVQSALQSEVDGVFGDRKQLTADDLKRIPYLKAFVKEVLRLYPIVPTNARVLEEDTVVNGYQIPKNTIVLLNAFTMCRDPNEFKNPDDFIPERWLRNEVKEFSPFTSLPFGFGARACVGRRIAETMIYMGIANIVKNYHITPVSDSTSVKPFVRTVLTLGNDLPVEFNDR